MVAHFVIENREMSSVNTKLSFPKYHWIPGIEISDQSGDLLKTHIIWPYLILFYSESVGKVVPLFKKHTQN